jgi:hypothetical protein
MARTIAQLKNDLARKLHGTNLNQVQDVNGLIDEAAREVLNDVDFYETKRIAQIGNAVYSDVYDYTLPTDLKGNKIIDIRPQVNRGDGDVSTSRYGVSFDRFKSKFHFTIRDNQGVRSLRYNKGDGTNTTIHQVNSITANGTWSVGDDGTNLTLDTVNYISGNGALNFDVDGSTTTVSLQNTDMTAVDLSDYEDQGAIFVWVFMPVVITDATLRWGTDVTANYWEDTVTAPQINSFQVGWNLLRFDWNGATETGSPSSSAVDSVKISLTYDGNADTDYRLDNIVCSLGEIHEIEYYSKYLFKNTSGTLIEEVSADTDEVVLDLEGYNCLLYKCLELAAPQIQAEDSGFDYQLYEKKYTQSKQRYKQKYRSEIRKPKSYYYSAKR